MNNIKSKSKDQKNFVGDWTFEKIKHADDKIKQVAEKYKLDTFTNQIEIVSANQMIEANSSIGLPINYSHWSFGKSFMQMQEAYRAGKMNLSYEMVINSDPCISYLMEENNMTMQALVIAHACYGHNSFFKGNYLFKEFTDPSLIIDYISYVKKFINECEEKYGDKKVEKFLDKCHSLSNYDVDKHKKPKKLSSKEEKELLQRSYEEMIENEDLLSRTTLPKKRQSIIDKNQNKKFPEYAEENILIFIADYSPKLTEWQRKLMKIVSMISQYFYPQRRTKVMNEGWATFWHYQILRDLYDAGEVNDGFMLGVYHSHSNVIMQRKFNQKGFQINPYAIGFAMMQDIKKICENPSQRDKKQFPHIANTNWVETFDYIMRNYKDSSFVEEFLSQNVIEKFNLFSINYDQGDDYVTVEDIHDDQGYKNIKKHFSDVFDFSSKKPIMKIVNANINDSRYLEIEITRVKDQKMSEDSRKVFNNIEELWGYPVSVQYI